MSGRSRLRRFFVGDDPGKTAAVLLGACGFPMAFFGPLFALLTYEFGSPLTNFDGSPAGPADLLGMAVFWAAWWLIGVIPASWAADRLRLWRGRRRFAACFAAAFAGGTVAAGLCLPMLLF